MKDLCNWPSPDFTTKFGMSAIVIAYLDDPQTSIIFATNRPARKLDELDALPITDRPGRIRVAVWAHDATAAKIMSSLKLSCKQHLQPEHRLPSSTVLVDLPVETVTASLNAAIHKVAGIVWSNDTVCQAGELGLFGHTSPVGSRPRLASAA